MLCYEQFQALLTQLQYICRKEQPLDSPPRQEPDNRYAPDPAERYVPRAMTPEESPQIPGKSPEAMRPPGSAQKSTTAAPSSISPTPGFVRRSGTPSPSPAKVRRLPDEMTNVFNILINIYVLLHAYGHLRADCCHSGKDHTALPDVCLLKAGLKSWWTGGKMEATISKLWGLFGCCERGQP